AAAWRPTPGCAPWRGSGATRPAYGCACPGRGCAPTTARWSPPSAQTSSAPPSLPLPSTSPPTPPSRSPPSTCRSTPGRSGGGGRVAEEGDRGVGDTGQDEGEGFLPGEAEVAPEAFDVDGGAA